MKCPTCGRNGIKQTCERCKYEWYSQIFSPKQCPRCKSTYWNKDRKPTYEFARLIPIGKTVFLAHKEVTNDLDNNWHPVRRRWDALEKWLHRNCAEYTLMADIKDKVPGLTVWRKDGPIFKEDEIDTEPM